MQIPVEMRLLPPCSQRVVVLLEVHAQPENLLRSFARTSAYQRCPIDWDPVSAWLVERVARPAAVLERPRARVLGRLEAVDSAMVWASEPEVARPQRVAEPQPSRAEQMVLRPVQRREQPEPASERELVPQLVQVRRRESASLVESQQAANSNRAVPITSGRVAHDWVPPRLDRQRHDR